jgi:hypothetical protein
LRAATAHSCRRTSARIQAWDGTGNASIQQGGKKRVRIDSSEDCNCRYLFLLVRNETIAIKVIDPRRNEVMKVHKLR